MKAYFTRLVTHMDWANRRTLTALQTTTPPEEAVRLFVHVLTTEQIYHERMRGTDPWPQDFWPSYALEDCVRLVSANRALYHRFLADSADGDWSRRVHYRNSRGETFQTPLRDMLTHLMLHGQHHRGQIARVLRQHGHTPPVTDFITFVREVEKKDGS